MTFSIHATLLPHAFTFLCDLLSGALLTFYLAKSSAGKPFRLAPLHINIHQHAGALSTSRRCHDRCRAMTVEEQHASTKLALQVLLLFALQHTTLPPISCSSVPVQRVLLRRETGAVTGASRRRPGHSCSSGGSKGPSDAVCFGVTTNDHTRSRSHCLRIHQRAALSLLILPCASSGSMT